jgi:hypothetical protein
MYGIIDPIWSYADTVWYVAAFMLAFGAGWLAGGCAR